VIFLFTLKDLARESGISKRVAIYRVNKICELYDIERTLFNANQVPNASYELTEVSFYLLIVLLKSWDSHPLSINKNDLADEQYIKDKMNQVTMNQIVEYNEQLIENFEALVPVKIKRIIKAHPAYALTIKKNTLNNLVNDKLAHFYGAISTLDANLQLMMWEKLYESIDNLILESFELKYQKEMNSQLVNEKDEFIATMNSKPIVLNELNKQNEKSYAEDLTTIKTFDRVLAKTIKESMENYQKNKSIRLSQQIAEAIRTDIIKNKKVEQEYASIEFSPEEDEVLLQELKLIKRITGYERNELIDIRQDMDKEQIEATYSNMHSSKERALELIELSKAVVTLMESPLYLETDYARLILQTTNIKKQLECIIDSYQDLDNPLVHSLIDQFNYIIGRMDVIVNNNVKKEASNQQYYLDYINHYDKTKKNQGKYEELTESLVIRPSVEEFL